MASAAADKIDHRDQKRILRTRTIIFAAALLMPAASLFAIAQGRPEAFQSAAPQTKTSSQTPAAQPASSPENGTAAWSTEVVDNGAGSKVGKSPSLVIDRNGNFHVAYYNVTNKWIIYAFRNRRDKRWFRMLVTQKATNYLSLAIDSRSLPHLAFSSDKGALMYTFFDGKVWHPQAIENDDVKYFISLQLDAKGNPAISYCRAPEKQGMFLKYAWYDGKNWYIKTVDERVGTGMFNSLAVDADGHPHISYSYLGPGVLMYASTENAANWQISEADRGSKTSPTDPHHDTPVSSLSAPEHKDSSFLGYGNSIAMDPAGHPDIAYLSSDSMTMKYAHWDGKAWTTETVEKMSGDYRNLPGKDDYDHFSLKLDSKGHPHIAYYDPGMGALKYASRGDHGWEVEVADKTGNVGMFSSLAFDASDNPYIAYFDVSENLLRMTHRAGTKAANTEKKP